MLRIHMKNSHNESEDEQIERVKQTVESAMQKGVIADARKTSLDCCECGLCFRTEYAHISHMDENPGREE